MDNKNEDTLKKALDAIKGMSHRGGYVNDSQTVDGEIFPIDSMGKHHRIRVPDLAHNGEIPTSQEIADIQRREEILKLISIASITIGERPNIYDSLAAGYVVDPRIPAGHFFTNNNGLVEVDLTNLPTNVNDDGPASQP